MTVDLELHSDLGPFRLVTNMLNALGPINSLRDEAVESLIFIIHQILSYTKQIYAVYIAFCIYTYIQ